MSSLVNRLSVVCAVVICLALANSPGHAAEPFVQGPMPEGAPPPAAPGMLDAINREIAALNLPPHSAETPTDTAVRIRKAIKSGDFAAARQLVLDTLAATKMRPWRFYPFEDVIGQFSDTEDTNFEQRLNEWVTQSKNDAVPLLLRARFFFDAGWKKRGNGFSLTVPAGKMDSFNEYMAKALDDVNLAIDMDSLNPYGLYLRLQILHSSGSAKTTEAAFEAAIKQYPDYFSLYTIMLEMLEPKWGGSVRSMWHFVNTYADDVPDTSPLKMLYLFLYDDLLDTAQISCTDIGSRSDDKKYPEISDCFKGFMTGVKTPELDRQVQLALELYNHYEHEEFEEIAEAVIAAMLRRYGAAEYASFVMQNAGKIMNSSTELPSQRPQDTPSKNDYIIDKLMALSWRNNLLMSNAILMLREAVSDIQNTRFSSEGDRLQRLADIYHELADYYQLAKNPADAIVYESASLRLTSTTENPGIVCYGLDYVHLYAEAIRRCTDILANEESAPARFWRGVAYWHLRQLDEAAQDFRIVADSDIALRVNAAISLADIYHSQGNIRGALDIFDKYTFLFDATLAGRYNVARNYNNRCSAYKDLGELLKALDDCTESLKYGNIPGTFEDQQEIKRLLGKQ